jgi:hypothetical protein
MPEPKAWLDQSSHDAILCYSESTEASFGPEGVVYA